IHLREQDKFSTSKSIRKLLWNVDLATGCATLTREQLQNNNESASSSLALLFFPKKYCLVHAPLGPVASIATSIMESGVIHLRNTKRRKFRTAKKAKIHPVTGPQ
uniref:Uncharacterized protein n=1 Tax=Taeniopygia guttata TaxID=59729 RepID=A0A674H2H4_TAEGU